MDLGLGGKVALVTGGSYGIGKSIALRLAEEGVSVAIAARRESVLQQATSEITTKTGSMVVPVVADVSTAEGCERFVRNTADTLGRIDILVNNAGSSAAFYFGDTTDEMWQEDFDLKLMAAVRMCRLCIPEMRKVGGGRIVNMAMVRAKQPSAKSVPTSVTRAANVALTKALSKDYAPDNILVNAVLVGVIRSGQWERRYEQQKDKYGTIEDFYRENSKDIPLKRFGDAREVADLVAFLVSERAKYITGDAINIDGGTSAVV